MTALILEGQPFMVDPQAVQDGGLQVVDVNRVLNDVVAIIVCLANGDTGLKTPTGGPHGKATRMVIATIVGCSQLALAVNRSAELPSPNDQGILQ